MAFVKVFISYARDDYQHMVRLASIIEKDIKKYQFQNYEFDVFLWWDKKLTPGQKWNEEIEFEMRQADVVIFLVSKNFFKSKFILENEIPWAIKILSEGKKSIFHIIAINLEECGIQRSVLKDFQAIPIDKRTARLTSVIDSKNPEEYWAIVRKSLLSGFHYCSAKLIEIEERNLESVTKIKPKPEFVFMEKYFREPRIDPSERLPNPKPPFWATSNIWMIIALAELLIITILVV